MASQRFPWEPCHSCSRRGRGACGRSSCINAGVGKALWSHLESLLMTRIRAAFSSLSRWLSARRLDRAYGMGWSQAGGPEQAEPTAHSA